jgi:hypothetical protein
VRDGNVWISTPDGGGPFASPTWSPDGSMLAREQADGVHVAGPVPDLRRPVPDCSVIAQRRLAAGSDPYWGRADVPGATSGKPPLGKPVPPWAFRSLRVARHQRGSAVRLRLRISRGPARVTVRLSRGRTPAGGVVKRRARRGRCGSHPLNAKAKRALARSGRLALRLRVTVRAPGRATTTARRRVSLRG